MTSLPPYIFILGPKGCGKQTLANAMWSSDHTVNICSFDEIIREATVNIFFPARGMDIDFSDPEFLKQQCPRLPITIEAWMAILKRSLRALSHASIGDLLKLRLESMRGVYSSHIILDAEGPEDIKPFALAYGLNACLLLIPERQDYPIKDIIDLYSATFIPTLVLRGDSSQMIEQLSKYQVASPPA